MIDLQNYFKAALAGLGSYIRVRQEKSKKREVFRSEIRIIQADLKASPDSGLWDAYTKSRKSARDQCIKVRESVSVDCYKSAETILDAYCALARGDIEQENEHYFRKAHFERHGDPQPEPGFPVTYEVGRKRLANMLDELIGLVG